MERESTFVDKGFTQAGSVLGVATEVIGLIAGKLYEKMQPTLEVYRAHVLSRIFSRKIRVPYRRKLRFA